MKDERVMIVAINVEQPTESGECVDCWQSLLTKGPTPMRLSEAYACAESAANEHGCPVQVLFEVMPRFK